MTASQTMAGLEAIARHLAHLTSVTSVELLRIAIPPSIERRPGATAEIQRYADKARAAKMAGDSFTETFVGVAQEHGDIALALAVIDYHQPLAAAYQRIIVARSEISGDRLQGLARNMQVGEMLVLTSRVGTLSGAAHIPLLDLKMTSSPANTPAALEVAKRLGGGLVLDSGSSYHLYGRRLLNDEEFTNWLLRAQLFSRCVDTRWVTHQLLERRAALRLSRGGAKDVELQVVAEVP